MMELDRTFDLLIKTVNECYETLYPDLCHYPKFSFSRAMITLWKCKVYSKIKENLLEAFMELMQEWRSSEITAGKKLTEEKTGSGLKKARDEGLFAEEKEGKEVELVGSFVQTMVDLSVNELTVHYLGSTKLVLVAPYKDLSKIIFKLTK
eukprot:TRINITY_DN11189_c0_g1_i3.p3 TRINITY_DN11189_c0_g1~~TRINITY_DN11189_c0_g1_i3.p3  ORF type:complete len:150 (-),score=40.44 TRINITY_DN11189_c0_g1_i3:833-1282(-)